MKDCNKPAEFAKFVEIIFNFLQNISMEKYNPSKKLLKTIIGFVADMCTLYGREIKTLIQGNSFIFDNLAKIKNFQSKKYIEFFNWAEEVIID